MAKIVDNLILEGLRGQLGNKLVLKRTRGGRTILCKKPVFDENRQFSEKQLERQQIFSEATTYASKMKREPVYLALAKGTERTGYNVAMADWLNPPRILKIDLDGWKGEAQDLIRMQVKDDVKVDKVRVEIADVDGAIRETGQAMEAGGLWWEYRVSQALSGAFTVSIFASDLPGHETQASKRKDFSLPLEMTG